MPVTAKDVIAELRERHPGGFHYVDEMRWGDAGPIYYAVATIDHYYTSSNSLDRLLGKVKLNIKRGSPGNEYERGH